MTDPSTPSSLYGDVGTGNGRDNRREGAPLLEAGGLPRSYQQHGSLDGGGDVDDLSVRGRAVPKEGSAVQTEGRLLLLFVAFLYGSLNVSLRMVYARPGPPSASVLSTTRGWLGVTCFLPLLRMAKSPPPQQPPSSSSGAPSTADAAPSLAVMERERTSMFFRFAFELALFNFGTQGLINWGLLTVESARAAFLTQLSVVITPVLSACLGHRVGPKTWVACLVALVGLYVLSNTGGGLLSMHLTGGDLCCLGGAFCWSCYIFRLSAWGDRFDDMLTQFAKNVMLASMYTVWMVSSLLSSGAETRLWEGWRDALSWSILLYSALGPNTVADIVQHRAQSNVPAAEANVILSLEPVFTALLGLFLLGEVLSSKELCGGGLIVAASVLASA